MFMTNGRYHTVSFRCIFCYKTLANRTTWGSGPGASAHLNFTDHIEKWVIDRIAQEKIVGRKFSDNGFGTSNFMRPSYPWPYYTSNTGVGDWHDALRICGYFLFYNSDT